MINGAFMEDLSELLNSATGDERRRRTFYEIDTKFEKNDIVPTQELRQHAVVDALSSRKSTSDNDPGKDKDGWKKADEHLTVLMDQEHMITLEDTDAAVRRCEQHLERAAIDAAFQRPRFSPLRSWHQTPRRLNSRPSKPRSRPSHLKSKRCQLSCAATRQTLNALAMAPPWKETYFSVHCLTVFVVNGGTMLRIVGTNLTRTKQSSMLQRPFVTRRKQKGPTSVSRLAKKPRRTPPLLLLTKFWRRPLRPSRIWTLPLFTCPSMVLDLLHHRPLTSLGKWCLIRSLCHTPGTVLDCGAQVNILEGALGSGTRIQLTGITGDKTQAETANAVFPVIAADGSRHAISIRGKNIVATRATDNILSLAVLPSSRLSNQFSRGHCSKPN